MFQPTRLTVARMRNGLTMSALAGEIGKSARTVSDYETRGVQPPVETVERIVDVLGFPTEYFHSNSLDIPDENSVSFRALSKMSAIERDRALAQGALGIELNKWIELRFDLPTPELPDFSQEPNPEGAAATLRQQWELGEWPISNMVHLLEMKGVRVYSLSVDSLNVDAYSMWNDETPMIFLNTRKSAERGRFDAAHELGHLLLHRHAQKENSRLAEDEANQFASELLMPRAGTIARAPKFPTMQSLISGKKHWTVSVAALNYRWHRLKLTNDWQYRMLSAEIGKRGYRINEPNPAPRESSLLLQRVFTLLRDDAMSQRDLAGLLKYPGTEIEQLIFGLAITSIEGGRTGSASSPASGHKLRLIQ